jgi:hypothetical protein
MLTIPDHIGNANQNQVKNGYHQEHKQQQMLSRMWGQRNPHTLLVGI